MAFIQLDDFAPAGSDLSRILASKAILDVILNGHVTAVTIQAGGTGYAVGDVVELSAAGTPISTYRARFVVTSVSSGVVDGLEMRSGGAYSILPDQTTSGHATSTVTGVGTGLTVNVTVEGPYQAVPDAGGSGYSVGDVVTVTGGTGGTTDPTFVVTAVTGGAVDTLAPLNLGDRTTPVDTTGGATSTTTGGAGTGLTVLYNQVGWILLDSDYTDTATDFTWFAQGTNNSGTDPVIALNTELVGGAAPSINIRVSAAYDAGENFNTQPGTWLDGENVTSNRKVRICCTGTDPFSLFIYVSGRVVNFVFTDDTSYELGVAGCFIPFTDSPSTTFPAPLVAGGTVCNSGGTVDITDVFQPRGTFSNDARNNKSSILHCMSGSSTENDVAPYRCTNEVLSWYEIVSDSGFDNTVRLWPWCGYQQLGNEVEAPSLDGGVTPNFGGGDLALIDSNAALGQGYWADQTTGDGSPGPAPIGASGQLHYMAPPTLILDSTSGPLLLGQLEGVALINGRGLNDEDRVVGLDGRRWFVFPDTISNEDRAKCAMLEG